MDLTTQLHRRRAVIAGAAGLGIATVASSRRVAAQSTPEAGEETTTDTTEATRRDEIGAAAAARYDEFVAGLTASLVLTDTASVDTAIRDTLTELVAARLDAGELSADDAEAASTLIASSPAPLFGLRVLAGRRRGRGGFGGGFGRRDNDDGETDEVIPSTPAASV